MKLFERIFAFLTYPIFKALTPNDGKVTKRDSKKEVEKFEKRRQK